MHPQGSMYALAPFRKHSILELIHTLVALFTELIVVSWFAEMNEIDPFTHVHCDKPH